MAKKLNLVLAALFCFLALSSAAESQPNDVSAGDLPKESVPTFNPLIELPRANQEAAVVSELPATTESTEELTTVAFHHGHRHFKPEEMSFGNDMILSSYRDDGSDDVEEKPERWVKFHHGEEQEFGDSNGNDDVMRPDNHRHNHLRFEWVGDDENKDHRDHHHSHHRFDRDDEEEREGRHHHRRFEREGDDEREDHRDHHHHGRFDRDDDEEREGHGRRFDREDDEEREDHRDHHHRHGRFDRDDDEEREGRGKRFDREDDEEREGRHHHHRHHHHDHRRHHHDEDEHDDEEAGVVMKMRKFLMGRF